MVRRERSAKGGLIMAPGGGEKLITIIMMQPKGEEKRCCCGKFNKILVREEKCSTDGPGEKLTFLGR